MTIETAIEKAIEGEWKPVEEECRHKLMSDENGCPFGFHYPAVHKMLLDPLFWQALGKVEGWSDAHGNGKPCYGHHTCTCNDDGETWLDKMHRMIDALAEGKTITQFFETL